MWATVNRTRFGVGRAWGRDRDGVHEWIVAVRATFDIARNGILTPAEEQPEPLMMPEYNGEDGLSSIRYEADLGLPKASTDVILNGTAYAPGERASTDFMVSMRVDRVVKVLRVLGDRTWERSAAGVDASAAAKVTRVPIVYERAYGGHDATDDDPRKQKLDARNPVGTGVAAKREHLIGKPVHNFEYPGRSASEAGPAGFGAIAAHWSPRLGLLGTYDEEWQKKRKPLLPQDWDPLSLQYAPLDQRPPKPLVGGESVELGNLTPKGKLKFELPKLRFGFTTNFSTLEGTRSERHEGRLASVIIEPDHPRVIMVWHSSFPCRQDEDYLDETIVTEEPD